MKTHWQQIRNWFQQLAPREQRIIRVGLVVVGLILVYQWCWSPLVSHQHTLRRRIHTQETMLVWMQSADKQLQQAAKTAQPAAAQMTPVMLLSLIQKQIKEAGFVSQLKQLKQAGNDTVELHLQRVEFDKMMVFLTRLLSQHHVLVSQLSVAADVTPGIVNADIYFKV